MLLPPTPHSAGPEPEHVAGKGVYKDAVSQDGDSNVNARQERQHLGSLKAFGHGATPMKMRLGKNTTAMMYSFKYMFPPGGLGLWVDNSFSLPDGFLDVCFNSIWSVVEHNYSNISNLIIH